jgi:hypothetical protein
VSNRSARPYGAYMTNRVTHPIRPESKLRLPEAIEGVKVVYYVRLDAGAIKIGTTQNLIRRLTQLDLSLLLIPHRVLAVEFGSYALENQRHKQFAHLRIGKTEQFYEAPDLMAHIEELKNNLGLKKSA